MAKQLIFRQGQHKFKFNDQSIKVSLDHSKQRGNFLRSMFLPKSYPYSVTSDYFRFSSFQFVQSVTGTIAGTISTQAMLHALGLGAGMSMGLAATTNWIIKDGFGLLGGVLYAGFMGSRFDASPKRYRFWAALSIQGATLIEILTPFFPAYFVSMASVANVGKNIGWLASAATRAAMHKGFTKADNLGDVTAKSGAQATAAGLVGTGLGISISWTVGSVESSTIDPVILCSVFTPLSLINIAAAYFGNSSVVTRTLNEERLILVLNPVITSLAAGKIFEIATPDLISKQESVIYPQKSMYKTPLLICPSLIDLISKSESDTSLLFASLSGDQYSISQNYRIYITPENSVCLWFLKSCSDSGKLNGYFHANVICHLIDLGLASGTESVYRKSLELISDIDISKLLQSKEWEINNLHFTNKLDSSVDIKLE